MSKNVSCPECGCEIGGDTLSADPMRRHFFASIRDSFDSLSDEHRRRFPSSEVLRKTALINAGWCDVMTVVAGSKASAPGIKAALEAIDRYCIVDVRGDVLTVYRARSVSRRALLKKEFVAVKQKAFDWIYRTTGIDPDKANERAAAWVKDGKSGKFFSLSVKRKDGTAERPEKQEKPQSFARDMDDEIPF